MADNVVANPGAGGSTFMAPEFSFSGDTVKCPGTFVGILSGSEGSWTYTLGVGGAGAVTAGVARVTLASDDPGVASLATIAQAVHAEDAAFTNADKGIVLLAKRSTSPASTSDADGDYEPLQVKGGKLYVVHTDSIDVNNPTLDATQVGGGLESAALRVTIASDSTGLVSVDDNGSSLTVDNNGTFVVQENGAALTSLQLIDDIVYTDDTSTHSTGSSKGALFMAAATPTDSAVNANDIGAVAMTTDRKLHVSVQDALPAGTNAIGKLAANNGVDIGDVDVASIAAGDNNIGNVDIVTMPNVTLAAGTNTNEIVGDAAHDAGIAGNPVRIGARAETSLHTATMVSDGDTTDLYAGVDGVQIVRQHTNLEGIVSGVVGITDGSSTSVIASAGGSVKIYITEVIIANSSSTNVTVDLRDGTGGSVKATFAAPANSGCHKTLSTPLPFSAATAVAADPSAAASTITVTLIGFKSLV